MAECGESESESEFERAAGRVVRLVAERRLADADLLRLYAWYKQATVGACRGARPGLLSMAARRKWDAWHALGALPAEEAARLYVSAVRELDPGWEVAAERAPRGLGIAVSTFQREEEGPPVGGRTPFDLARAGAVDELTRLESAAIAWDEPGDDGLTLLHWAADRGHADVVRLLLARGAAVDRRDPDGQTALHYASSCQHAAAVRALVEGGADVTARDADGLTPLDVAADEVRPLLAGAPPGGDSAPLPVAQQR